MEKIALCIPAFNAEKFLPRLLSSAHAQIIPFDEILVYDDCSTDATAAIAEQYGARVITGIHNMGCSVGKQTLAEKSGSEWIHFHDADDLLLPQFTSLAHKWITLVNCPDVVLFNYGYVDDETGITLGKRIFDSEALKKDPIKYAIMEQINPFCGLYKKKSFLAAGGYDVDPNVLYYEDSAMHISLAIAGLTFGVEPEISIINYRVTNSMSQLNNHKCVISQYHVMEKYATLAPPEYNASFGKRCWDVATFASRHKDWNLVKKSIFLAKKLGSDLPSSSPIFELLCRINFRAAFFVREYLIRLFKPRLRNGH